MLKPLDAFSNIVEHEFGAMDLVRAADPPIAKVLQPKTHPPDTIKDPTGQLECMELGC